MFGYNPQKNDGVSGRVDLGARSTMQPASPLAQNVVKVRAAFMSNRPTVDLAAP